MHHGLGCHVETGEALDDNQGTWIYLRKVRISASCFRILRIVLYSRGIEQRVDALTS